MMACAGFNPSVGYSETRASTTSSRRQQNGKMEEPPSFSLDQAHELITHIDHVRLVLQHYVHLTQPEDAVKPRRKSWWGRHCWPNQRRFLYRFVTIITVCLQFLNLFIITMIDTFPRRDSEEKDVLDASSTTMIILQIINLMFLILASGRLAKQIYRHAVNRIFLAQNYFATILLFAGIYTLTFRIERRSWRFVSEDLNDDPIQVFLLYAKFLFYSISTATLCGSDNVLPVGWYNCIFAAFQMLLSFCYFASILGSAIGNEFQPSTTHSSWKPQNSQSASSGHLNQQQLRHQQQQQQQHQNTDEEADKHRVGKGESKNSKESRIVIHDTSDVSPLNPHIVCESTEVPSNTTTTTACMDGRRSGVPRHQPPTSNYVTTARPTIQCYSTKARVMESPVSLRESDSNASSAGSCSSNCDDTRVIVDDAAKNLQQ